MYSRKLSLQLLSVLLLVCLSEWGCFRPKTKLDTSFEVVSAKRIDSVESRAFGDRIAFTDPTLSGVQVVLKSKSPDGLVYYSTDFSLGYDATSDIPRSPCVAISNGSSATAENDWDWMLTRGVARYWTTSDKPYFAVVFAVPKNVSEFTLYYAAPAGAKIILAK